MKRGVTVSLEASYVKGVAAGDSLVERRFYDYCHSYFMRFFSMERSAAKGKDDFFQDALVQIWSEIWSGRIFVEQDIIYRIRANGKPAPMTASLRTFLIAIAINQYKKSLREAGVDSQKEYSDDYDWLLSFEGSPEEVQWQIVLKVLAELSPSCREILTLFYLEEKTLSDIMTVRSKNMSKDGLKTRKNKCMNTAKHKAKRYLEIALKYGTI